MANGYRVEDKIKDTAGVDCPASSTTVIAGPFRISGEDSRNLLVTASFSDIAETTGASVVLQDSHNGGTTWATVKSATLTTVAEVQTLTFDTKANTGDGDYVVVYDTTGQAWAVAADKTGSSAEPTGAIWTAIPAGNKAQADISGDTTAADVAASFETAFDGITGFTAVITSDDSAADGTMTMTQVVAGDDADDAVTKDEDDGTAGSISAANTTASAETANYELENNIYDGTDTAMWPLARVVVTTGTGDTATASAVYVSRRL